MDPRVKDSVKNTEEMVQKVLDSLAQISKDFAFLKKEFKSIKRANVRKYKKNEG